MIPPLPLERRLLAGWLAALLAWTPLPFGSVTPLGLLILRLAVLAAALLVVWSETLRGGWRPVRTAALALLALAALGLVQAAPWPPGLARRVSPLHAELAAGLPLDALPGAEVWTRLTLAAGATLSTALSFAVVAALVVVAAAAGRSARARGILLGGFTLGVAFQLLYGLRQWLARSYEIWGRAVEGQQGRLRGTFVNADHAALYFEIAMAVAFAWTWWAARRSADGALERRLLALAPPLALWSASFLGVVLTGSRAGLLAALVGVTAQAALLVALDRRRWRLAPLVALPAAVAVGVALLTASGQGFARLLGTSPHEVLTSPRFRVWALGLELWCRFPGTGSGLGTFGEAMAMVQPADMLDVRWTRAHNDYLELLVTAGVLGLALLAVVAAALLRRLLTVLRDGRRSAERAAALAALGALAAVGVHELFDFGLSVPANTVACATLVAAAVAGPSRPAAGGSSPGAAPDREPAPARAGGAPPTAAG